MEWYVIMGYILFGCFAIGVSVVPMWIALKRQKSYKKSMIEQEK